MGVIYFLLPASIFLAVAGLAGFFWAVKRGQYDDVDTPAVRMLADEEVHSTQSEEQ